MEYWVVKESYQIAGGDITQTSEHKFRTEDAAREWAANEEKKYIGMSPLSAHRFEVERVKINFEGDEEPFRDYGPSYRGW
jgi:hypothetical protein